MPFFRKTVILDCGASRIALGVFSAHRGGLRLDRHRIEVLPPGDAAGSDWLEATASALQRLREPGARHVPCVLVVPGHLVLTKFITVPRVNAEQRRKVIHFETEQQMPVPLSELVWDSAVSGEKESGLEVMLAASHAHRIKALLAAARAAGFEPKRAIPAPLALLAAYRHAHGGGTRPVAVFNLGARSTTLLLVEADRFVTRTFAFAAAPGGEGDAAQVAARLALELVRSLEFFRRQAGLADPAQVFLAGGGAWITALGEVLACRLKLPVAPLDLSAACDGARGVMGDGGAGPLSPDLVGAAAAELREGHTVLNLLPSTTPSAGRHRHIRQLVVAALVAVSCTMSVRWYFQSARPQVARLDLKPAIASRVDPPVPVAGAVVQTEPAAAEGSTEALPPAIELIGIQREPYRLQLAGYLGERGDYSGLFVGPGLSDTIVAKQGHRFDSLRLVLRKFEVRRVPVAHADSWPVDEVAAFATLYDEATNEEITLDSRKVQLTPPRAQLRIASRADVLLAAEREEFSGDGSGYRIEQIRMDPPEVVVARLVPGATARDFHTLRAESRISSMASPKHPATLAPLASTGR